MSGTTRGHRAKVARMKRSGMRGREGVTEFFIPDFAGAPSGLRLLPEGGQARASHRAGAAGAGLRSAQR